MGSLAIYYQDLALSFLQVFDEINERHIRLDWTFYHTARESYNI